jgi:hypothetical protein
VRNDTDSNLHVLAYFSSINGEVCLLPTFAAFRKSKTSGYYHDIVGAVDFVTLGPGETGVTDVHTDLLPDRSCTGKGVLITVSTSLCPHAQGAEIFERVLKLLRERSQHDRLLGDGTVSVDIDWLVCAQ